MYRIPKMILTEGASGQRVDSKSEGFQLGLHAPKKKDRQTQLLNLATLKDGNDLQFLYWKTLQNAIHCFKVQT